MYKKFYKTIKFSDLNKNEQLVGFKGNSSSSEAGIIFANYIPVTRTEPNLEYDNFMKQYDLDHARCPECGSTRYSTTYLGYILNMDKKEDYKDLNRCICSECGNVHTTHDRVK